MSPGVDPTIILITAVADGLISRFIDFFAKKGHELADSARLRNAMIERASNAVLGSPLRGEIDCTAFDRYVDESFEDIRSCLLSGNSAERAAQREKLIAGACAAAGAESESDCRVVRTIFERVLETAKEFLENDGASRQLLTVHDEADGLHSHLDELKADISAKIDEVNRASLELKKTLGRCLTPKAALVSAGSVLGRGEFIEELQARLWEGAQGGVRRLQLTGMGGIGKSETLKRLYTQYATHSEADAENGVDAVGFLTYNGSMDEAILQINAVGQAAAEDGTDRLERAWQYLGRLAETRSLLLLIDDVSQTATGKTVGNTEDPSFEKLFSLNIPVIFASRSLWQGFEEVRVPPLSPEALQTIYERARGDEVPAGSRDSLYQLFEERAGHNTLVVQRFGSIAKETGFDVAGLRGHLDEIGFIFSFSDGSDDERLQGEIDKLYSVDGLAPSERSILEAFSFFPAQMLTMGTCVAWLKEDAGVLENAFRKTLVSLVDNTWLQGFTPPEAGSPLISIHQLVATAVSHQSQPSPLEHGGLISACAKSLSYGVKEGFQAATPFVAAAEGIAAHLAKEMLPRDDAFDERSAIWEAAAKLFNWLGCHRNDAGDFQAALGYHEKALAVRERVLGEEHVDTARSYNNVALVYHTLGDYEKALGYLEKTLMICKEVLGEEHVNTARSYANVAEVCRQLGDYDKALGYHEKALMIRERVLGEGHVDTARSYNNVALVYHTLGDYEKTLMYLKKALAVRERVLGEGHVDTARSYDNVAVVYHALGNYEKALEFHKKALAICEAVFGEEHVDTARSYNNIAGVYRDRGDYDKALGYHEKALAVRERVLGEGHIDTATSYNNIAGVYHAQNNYSKAFGYFEKALAVRERVLGEGHIDTAVSYNNIAAVYQTLGDYEKALGFHRKALAVRKRVLGDGHVNTAKSHGNIAAIHHALGDYDKALEYFEKAVRVFLTQLGSEHPFTQTTLKNMYGTYQASGGGMGLEEWCASVFRAEGAN